MISAGAGHFALLMVAIGIMAAFVPAPIYSRAPQVVSPARLGWAFGLIATLNNVGVFVGPQTVGWSRDVTGSYGSGFALMALLAVLSAATGITLRVRKG
jgi:nitrate/nitrite transporter NarK